MPQEQLDRETRDLELTVMDTFGEDDSDDSTSETSTSGSEQGSSGTGRGSDEDGDGRGGRERPDDATDPDEDPREEHPGEEEEVEEEASTQSQSQDKLYPKVRADKRGNLIDPKTGKVVAPAGPARRFYEDLITSRQRQHGLEGHIVEQRRLMSQAGEVIRDLKSKLDAKDQADTIPKQLGLTPDEHMEAMQVFAKFKNPATAMDAIKYVLTKAIQRGIDIKTLGLPANAGLDVGILTKDIVSQIKGELSPLTDRLTASKEQQAALENTKAEINSFLQLNPEARQYLPVLVKMAQQPELAHMNLQEAWLRLLLHLRTRQQTQRTSTQGEQPGNNAGAPRMSRPSGRSRPGADVDGSQVDNSPVNVNTEYKQLIKEVVGDLGGIDFS